MPQNLSPPHRLQPDTPLPDNLARINDNFDKVVSDLSDLGAFTTTLVGIGPFVLGPGLHYAFAINLTDSTNRFPGGIGNITPRAEIYIDGVDDEDTWPILRDEVAGAVDGFSDNLVFQLLVSRRSFSSSSGNPVRGTLIGMIRNDDVSSHVYTILIDSQFVKAAGSGRFR